MADEEKPQVPAGTPSPPAGDGSPQPEGQQVQIPEVLPLLPVRDVVVFPFMILPLFVGRESSVAAVNDALSKDRMILLCAQKQMSEEDPKPEGIYPIGTASMIMRMLKLPDGRVKILVQGLARAKIKEFTQTTPPYFTRVEMLSEPTAPTELSLEVQALMRTVKENLEKIIQLGKAMSPDLVMVLESITDPGRFCDLIAANIGMNVEEAQGLLEIMDPKARLEKVNEYLNKELELMTVQARIQNQAKEEMNKTQRDYFLREQLRAIQQELGEVDEKGAEIAALREKITKAGMPEEANKEALSQLKKLEMMHPDAMEASTVRSYLEWLVELPWSVSTKDSLNLSKAHKILDEDHYDLSKVKERILEYLAVRKLNPKMKGPILCFVGPPGVGKTSLGKSIARAMGRKFIRMSLGGIRDEAEIRGHRRTYVGALPGRIIQGIKQAGSNNPVFMLDEVDKLGMDFRGDPSAALLEVLDPEQNFSFRDHYINLPFDLSKVMFITTANQMDPVPPALNDRMEVLELSGYTLEEKVEIAKQYLLPRQMKENGIGPKFIEFTDEALIALISQYTREAGLRNAEREIGNISRKVARNVAGGKKAKIQITDTDLHTYLGPPHFLPEEERVQDEVGVATGLAWTPTGGEILMVEASITQGAKNLILTGHLGEVMRESAQAALSYAKKRAPLFQLPEDFFDKKEIHVHVPAGAIPKDGPSAGVTMATSLFSAMSGIPVRRDVAMTGEITLRGKVLPIGGLKDKALAALRNNITNLIVPERNRKDLEEIPANLREKINFIFVKNMDEVLKAALADGHKWLQEVAKKPPASKGRKAKTARPTRATGGASSRNRTKIAAR